MRRHFYKRNEDFTSIRLAVFVLFSILTLFVGFFLFYEWGMESYYWKNRLVFLKLLRNKKVKIVKQDVYSDSNVTSCEIEIEGEFYNMRYRKKENKIALGDLQGNIFIGLFISSPFMHWANKQIVKEINALLAK
jgi:hypothetical protein